MTFSQKGFDRLKVVEDAKILSLNFFKTKLRGFAIREDKICKSVEKVWGIVALKQDYQWLANP